MLELSETSRIGRADWTHNYSIKTEALENIIVGIGWELSWCMLRFFIETESQHFRGWVWGWGCPFFLPRTRWHSSTPTLTLTSHSVMKYFDSFWRPFSFTYKTDTKREPCRALSRNNMPKGGRKENYVRSLYSHMNRTESLSRIHTPATKDIYYTIVGALHRLCA